MARTAAAAALAALAALGSVRADDVRVSASVLPSGRISDTTQIRLVVQIEGSSIPDVATPRLPSMTNLRIVAGPSTSRNSSYSFVNGRVTSANSITLTYVLLADAPGPAEIPPFDVVVGGVAHRTQPIRLQVQEGRSGPRAGGKGEPRDGDEDEPDVDIYLQSRVSSREVWVGEPLVLEVELYAGAPVADVSRLEAPSLSGMWSEDLPVDAARERRQESVGGRSYSVFPLLRKLVIPTRPGRLDVGTFAGQVQVKRPSRDPFRTFFSLGEFVHIMRKTRPVEITAKALPAAGRPPEFDGAVGNYTMRLAAVPQTVAVGDAVAIRATVEGRGSLQAVPPPRLAPSADLKMYEPKVVEDEREGTLRLTSRKTWEWIVVPVRPGEFELPEVTFAYFDPGPGRYEVVGRDLPLLTVRRGEGPVDLGTTQAEVQAAGKDIAFLKPRRGTLGGDAAPLARRPVFLALFVVPWALVPIGIWWGRRRERLATDRGFARSRRAARAAAKRLGKAEARTEVAAFHEEVARALVDYVADRENRSAAGLTYEEVDALLAARRVDADLRRRYRACLERCDFARFVPDARSEASRSEVVGEARAIVAALEAAW